MRLHYEHELPTSPERAWPFLTQPALMNRWSSATITSKLPGDQGLLYGVGATRVVNVTGPLGSGQRLHEVIEISEPPHRMVYRVVDSPPVRAHRGEIRLEPTPHDPQRCTLHWTVDIELALATLEPMARRLLDAELFQKSLSALSRLLERAPEPHPTDLLTTPTPEDPPETREALFASARDIAEQQRAHADTLFARDDPKRWFARVYQYVTEAQIEHAASSRVTHTAWVLHLIPVFHRYYFEDNLLPRIRGQHHRVERHWRTAFDLMEGDNPRLALFLGLRSAIIAHIEHDLPRALAEVYADHFAARCDYARFRADYLLMADLFGQASSRLVAGIPRSFIPWYYHLADRFLVPEVKRAIERKSFYDVGKARREAFERGESLARLLVRRLHAP